ncbi:LysR family transcriptional regulator [Allokutzneria sp. NRRL B-24872]|uniref:LysR family transcriptional regulator n=1 Tax=Allokutzneria sp. NRRL B-24872 TaxID=1137961 RepID=UPI001FF059C5|nr:LysR family transcriptional regulator [Allokutzneria sp. NRRL B-24872]
MDDGNMETRRLQLLLELSRLGSMRAVADALGTTTSSVSQQIAVLAREAGTPLLEPDGRRVRLTPAGRRLAEHAVTILAAVESARADLHPGTDPVGTVRTAGFATAISRSLLPLVLEFADSHPGVRMTLHEHEPAESLALLVADEVDLAMVYDYNLAPSTVDPSLESSPLWTASWALGVPEHLAAGVSGNALAVFEAFHGHDLIGNSRNRADEDVVRVLTSLAGSGPVVRHQADSLDLVEEMIVAGLGIGLLPAERPHRAGVRLLPLAEPEVRLRSYAVIRRGRRTWPPLALVLNRLNAVP